jgi:hypothetical protein
MEFPIVGVLDAEAGERWLLVQLHRHLSPLSLSAQVINRV